MRLQKRKGGKVMFEFLIILAGVIIVLNALDIISLEWWAAYLPVFILVILIVAFFLFSVLLGVGR